MNTNKTADKILQRSCFPFVKIRTIRGERIPSRLALRADLRSLHLAPAPALDCGEWIPSVDRWLLIFGWWRKLRKVSTTRAGRRAEKRRVHGSDKSFPRRAACFFRTTPLVRQHDHVLFAFDPSHERAAETFIRLDGQIRVRRLRFLMKSPAPLAILFGIIAKFRGRRNRSRP